MLVMKYEYTCVFNHLLNIMSYKNAHNLARRRIEPAFFFEFYPFFSW